MYNQTTRWRGCSYLVYKKTLGGRGVHIGRQRPMRQCSLAMDRDLDLPPKRSMRPLTGFAIQDGNYSIFIWISLYGPNTVTQEKAIFSLKSGGFQAFPRRLATLRLP